MTTKHSTLMFITNFGRMYQMKGFEVPEGGRTARGTAIVNMLKLKEGEFITAGIDNKDWSEDKHLLLATKKGLIKKIELKEFANVRQNGIKALGIKDGDTLIAAKITSGKEDVFLIHDRIDNIAPMLVEMGFYRPMKSMIINFDKVIQMSDGEIIFDFV
ncbi:MAG: hypothetical protein MJ151_01965 [Lachnospiraceae bacterium]|nr:hypothetical protein [Lachnospiraceae bacterium]